MMKRAKFILFLFLSLWITELSAQTTKVRGRVTDAKTGEPLPLVSISFVGTTIGITTDLTDIIQLKPALKCRRLWRLIFLTSGRW